MKFCKCFFIIVTFGLLAACSTTTNKRVITHSIDYKGTFNDPIMAITLLTEQQREWAGTPYRLGGRTRQGIDCSGFVQTTFFDRFGINLPRTTKEQAKMGYKINRNEIQTGDLVFFKTGRGPYGYHVGVYVKEDKFLHASTKGGVIYSSLNSPYWKKTYWQARRI
ncbi:putative lipoprotein NlpC [Bisgaardia hudsonensis]|uniref:Putative lipoprotein NlpC n=1 Tax=Bisgaardia hudsonensis TaxID=109472 RepID=A0A4R2N1H2_9PAST|nr:NlpC/P60 family protein [Bisgaardia hudsonensis]QLB13045.1 endopeptidase [Bisgaardia hudsonensis]TCP13390.1 putative lipoprotein NlpC [Bisgaardia hudsonensis]